jgi:glycosyltransferase involved in cell wall biosynthesis
MSTIPKISVIMPAYNQALFIRDAVESVLGQTLTDFELIIIDDGSTDGTARILKELSAHDQRIFVITNTQRSGVSVSLNSGLDHATGKYIARMDADDVSLPDRFQIEYDFMESHPEVFLIGAWVLKIDATGHEIGISKQPIDPAQVARRLTQTTCFWHPTIFFRQSDLRYRVKMHHVEDYDLYLRLLTDHKIIQNIPQVVLKYRIHPGSISLKERGKQELFRTQAKVFFQQRMSEGKDRYDSFDPNIILSIDPTHTDNAVILMGEIHRCIRINDFKSARRACSKYISYHGWFNRVPWYYLATWFGPNFWSIKRKLRP